MHSLRKIEKALSAVNVIYPKERAEVVRLVYFAMRLIDDIVDGDTPVEFPVTQRDAVVQEKKKTMKGVNALNKKDLFDVLTEKIFEVSNYIGETKQVAQGTEELMESMAFDARRIEYRHKTGKLERKSEQDLQLHFHQLDVRGTIYPTSALFGLEPGVATNMLEPLGNACRKAYTLMDLLEDPKHGLLNISLEDILKYDIEDDDIEALVKAESLDELPFSVKRWCAGMIFQIEGDVSVYQYNMSHNKIPLTYTKNPLVKYLYNLMLKKIILPKGYMGDINEVRQRYAPIVGYVIDTN